MANTCPHGFTLAEPPDPASESDPLDREGCNTNCANCGHNCHWHMGQASADGPPDSKTCLHWDCGGNNSCCPGYVDP